MILERVLSIDDSDWLRLRSGLWPDCSTAEHLKEMVNLVARPERFMQFVARDADREALGLAEASIRTDNVNGTRGSPVGFLEGLYVVPGARRMGVARSLVEAVAEWVLSRGCRELASDTELENVLSQIVHRRLGFAEAERVVCFNKSIGRVPPDDEHRSR